MISFVSFIIQTMIMFLAVTCMEVYQSFVALFCCNYILASSSHAIWLLAVTKLLTDRCGLLLSVVYPDVCVVHVLSVLSCIPRVLTLRQIMCMFSVCDLHVHCCVCVS